jgi:hypothetical protein
MSDEVVDLRKGERFIVLEPLAGTFGASDVTITNIGLTGLQIVHAQPMRIGTRARLAFTRGEIVVTTQARVVWSHLSQSANPSGKLLYNSGIRIESTDPQFALALNSLFRSGAIRQDSDSLEKKRERVAQRELQRRAMLKMMPKT